MDKIDLDIIALLQKNGRIPFTEVAAKLDISEGTVRNRVSRLTNNNVLQIIAVADPPHLGFDSPAIIGISVQPQLLEKVAHTIENLTEVSYLIMVSGEFDLFVEVMCRDHNHLASFLNNKLLCITGITKTQTFLILRTFKLAYGATPANLHVSEMFVEDANE